MLLTLNGKNKMSKKIKDNAFTIQNEINWLITLIDNRLKSFFENTEFDYISPPNIENDSSNYANFLKENQFSDMERVILISTISSYFQVQIFDKFLIKNKVLDQPFTEFGGKVVSNRNLFIPTLETISFIFHNNSIQGKIHIQTFFEDDHIFKKKNILYINYDDSFDSFLFSTLSLSAEFIQFISLGKKYRPTYSSNFPANILSTALDWEDLILDKNIIDELKTINTWVEHSVEIKNDISLLKKINSGYKALFYGPPGTGKTLTASLLGKMNSLDVYRVDLSQIVSKYIGETEKNLSRIFDIAENKNWILFFDEAESLFSKRTSVGDSKDKFANQQTAYLLQRVENYNGLIILATNLKPNIDDAFSRRLQSVIYYKLPNKSQRLKLWMNALDSISNLTKNDLNDISTNYELSGGSIKNIIQHAWLLSKQKNTEITINHIRLGIKRELNKEGKVFEID